MCQGVVVSIVRFGKKRVVLSGIGSHSTMFADNKKLLEERGWKEDSPDQSVVSYESDFTQGKWGKFTHEGGDPGKGDEKIASVEFKKVAGSASSLINHVRRCNKIDDALLTLLTAPARKTYEDVTAQAWKMDEDVRAHAWKMYEEVTAPAWKMYEEVAVPAWETYEDVRAQARKTDEDVTAQAWKTFEDVMAPSRKTYEDVKAQAWKMYEEVTVPAWETYEDVRAQAFVKIFRVARNRIIQ